MAGEDEKVDVIAFPDSHRGIRAASPSRVIVLGEVLFHREALARALDAYDDVAVIGSVADVHAALILAEERGPDVLLVDSPSHESAQALAAHPFGCQVVVIGVGKGGRDLGRRTDAIFVGANASLDEVHVALRFARSRHLARGSSPGVPRAIGGGAGSVLTQRELEVSRLLAGGCSNKEIAAACGISVATVKNHVHRILAKLNFQRRAQVAGVAADPPLAIARKRAAST